MTERWQIIIRYVDRSRVLFIEELNELQDIMEREEDWNNLKNIEIKYNLGDKHRQDHY